MPSLELLDRVKVAGIRLVIDSGCYGTGFERLSYETTAYDDSGKAVVFQLFDRPEQAELFHSRLVGIARQNSFDGIEGFVREAEKEYYAVKDMDKQAA